jgi:hypothetical protein
MAVDISEYLDIRDTHLKVTFSYANGRRVQPRLKNNSCCLEIQELVFKLNQN